MTSRPETHLVVEALRAAMATGQRPLLTVTSNSMWPLLSVGDGVRVAAVDGEGVAVGDVVVIVEPQGLLTHRVCALEGDQILTRGDRVAQVDPPHAMTALLGRVVARRRGGAELALDEGAGARLHNRLGRLAAWEFKLLGRQPKPQRPWLWLARRLFVWAAKLAAYSP